MNHRRMALVALSVGGLVLAPASAPRAEPADPSLPSVVVVGATRSPAALDRLTPSRRARSSKSFPTELAELARKNVGAIAHAPIAHPDGSVSVALSSPEIVRVAPDGAELSRVRIGSAPASRAPVLLSSGALAVLTTAPSVVFVSDAGKVLSTALLPRGGFGAQVNTPGIVDAFASIVPTEDGSVLVAGNRLLLEIDASARVRVKLTLPERIASDLIPHPKGLLMVSETGAVYRLRPPAEPRKIGALGGFLPGTAVLLDERTLVAEAMPNRIIALDLRSGAAVTRVGATVFSAFDSQLAVDDHGGAWVTATEGFLVGYDAAGAEIARVPVDRNAVAPGALGALFGGGSGAGFGGRPPVAGNLTRPGPIVDPDGKVAFVRPGRVGVRDEAGKVILNDRICAGPIALLPVAEGRLALACHDGNVVFYGASAAATPATD